MTYSDERATIFTTAKDSMLQNSQANHPERGIISATFEKSPFERAVSEIEYAYVSLGHSLGWRFLCEIGVPNVMHAT